jgi:hypothetical protein
MLRTPTEGGTPDTSQNASLETLKSAFGNETLEEMRRLSNVHGSGASLTGTTASGSGTQNGSSNASWQDTMPSLLNVTLEEMQHLSSTNLRVTPWPASNPHVGPHHSSVEWSSSPSGLETNEVVQRMKNLMKRSSLTQKALQDWDEENGLPRSHSTTMVRSSRSRKQLQAGKIIAKWDGTPLISIGAELEKPKARASDKKSRS